MNQVNINSRLGNKCAFCKHWYDPTNTAINPKVPNIGLWEYDSKIEKKCLLKNINMKAFVGCNKFESKLR